MMVPLGSKDGSTHLPIFGGLVFGGLLTRMKGKGYMAGRMRGQVAGLAS